MKVIYNQEDINKIIFLINDIEIRKGVNNSRKLCDIAFLLEKGEVKEDSLLKEKQEKK